MARNYLRSLLGDQEEIQLVSRQHWFVLFRMVILELIAMLVLVVILVIAQASLPNIPVGFGYVLLVLPLISIAREFMIWWNRQIVITNRRVIQLSDIINKNVIDSSLE